MAYKEYNMCIKPHPDLTTWRYMSFEKFELMLKNRSVFFCRADKFPDPFEGTIPKVEAEYRFKTFGDTKSINSISNLHRKFKGQLLVNCWHINNTENDAMWRLYLKDNEGIAIKTTVKNLLDSFSNTKEDIYCSEVRYIDYEKDIWLPPFNHYNLFSPILHKRDVFRQEKEIRLIHQIENVSDLDKYWQEQPKEKGKDILVDLNKLIVEIYSAPTSDERQIDKIKSLIKEYGFDFKVKKSVLDNEPYY